MFSIFKNINKYAGRWKFVDVFAVFGANYLIYILVGHLLITSIISKDLKFFVFGMSSAVFAAFAINSAVQYWIREKRPVVLKISKLLIAMPKNSSFPSNHSAFAFGISFSAFVLGNYFFWPYFFCACLIGLSRIFCGVHWAKDIIGGALSGLISSFIIYNISLYLP